MAGLEELEPQTEYKSTEHARRQRKARRRIWLIAALFLAFAAGGYGYYQVVYLPSNQVMDAEEASMQTATIRQGDLVLYASGAGELIAKRDMALSFPVSAAITAVNVKTGDHVSAGEILMTVDTADLASVYQDASRAFNELISPAAVARAKQQVAAYELEVETAESALEYYISPEVYYYDQKLAAARADLALAQADGKPDAISSTEREIADAEAGLKRASYSYQTWYLPEYFSYQDCEGVGRDQTCTEYVSGPSDAAIRDARYSLELNQALLAEAQDYLTLITSGSAPEGSTGPAISSYFSLLDKVQAAQENLESADLSAPISGVITGLAGEVGDPSGTGVVATIADISNLYIQVYLDASDWDKIALGYDVEVIFDALPDQVFQGVVVQVDPLLTSSGSLIGGLVELDPQDHALLAKMPLGSTAAVEVIGGRAEDAVLVPVEALREVTEGQYAVFVIEDGEPKLRPVEIGLMDIFFAEVISGLEVGEVVTTGIVETE